MNKIVLCCALAFFPTVAWAELEVITLQHRSAEDVLPVVRPLLDKDGVASGMNSQLILRTSPHNLAEIKKLLEGIDIVPRRLRVTVMQDVDRETARRLIGISGEASLGHDVRIAVQDGMDAGGVKIEAGRDAGRIRARVLSTRALESDRNIQQIQVLEGGRAWVSAGKSAPVTQRQVVRSPWGTQVTESMQYRDVVSGFYVLPRISGNQVTLEISVQNDALAPDGGNQSAARVQQMATTVSGRLGEWLVLGDISQRAADDGAAISTRNVLDMHERRNVLLRVEEAD